MSKPAARPVYESRVRPGVASWASQIRQAARTLGLPFMPWQGRAARIVGELRSDGLPRFDTVLVSVPRQSGKTHLGRSVITARASHRPHQRLYGTAQTRKDARDHLEALGLKLNQVGVPVVTRMGVGNERIAWSNGSWFEVFSPTPAGGHGFSMDYAFLDEVWALEEHVMASIVPARAAKPDSQLLAISTAGTPESVVWNSLLARARDTVDDPEARIGIVEYAAPSDDACFDSSRWHEWMPALGKTISYEAVKGAMDTLPPAEFIRAYGNRLTRSLSIVWPGDWIEDAWTLIPPPDRFVVAVDVNDDPAGACVATGAITTEGKVALRLAEWRWGTPRWVVPLVEEMIDQRDVLVVAADFGGPAREIRTELQAVCEAKRVELVDRMPRDLAADHGRFYDGLRERSVLLEKSEPLVEAVEGSVRKNIGDLWVVSRRLMLTDASPILSIILAFGLAVEKEATPHVSYAVY